MINFPKVKAPTAQQVADAVADQFFGKPAIQTESAVKKKNSVVTAESFSSDTLGTPLIPAHRLARVSVTASRTISLVSFESARFQVEISLPCDVAEVDSTYNALVNEVNEKMVATIKQLQGG